MYDIDHRTRRKQRLFRIFPGIFGPALMSLLLTTVATALPFSGSGNGEPKTNTELSKNLFPGNASHKPVTANDKHYFYVEDETRLPPLTRVKVELYYVRGKPPISYLTHREITRVTDSGHLKTRVLGLRRPLWAGKYKLVFTLNPANQIPKVKKKLNDRVDNALRRTQTWFYGTKEKRKKQREKAMKAARRDLKAALQLAGDLKQKLTNLLQQRKTTRDGPPIVARLNLALDWWTWSRTWQKQLNTVRRRNRRRPRLDGRTISFFEPESSTAYFLGADLKNLRELYDLAWAALASDFANSEAARRFQKKHSQLRTSVSRTMISLNLVVPLPETDRKAFRKNLEKMQDLMTEMETLLTNATEDAPDDDWSARLQNRITSLLQLLLGLNTEIPDVIYQRFLKLTQQLNRFSNDLGNRSPAAARKAFNPLKKQFRNARDLSTSFLKAMK